MARTLVASDSFSYSDGDLATVSAGVWQELRTLAATFTVASQALECPYSSLAIARWVGGGSWTANQYAKATMTSNPGRCGVAVRASGVNDATACYVAFKNNDGNTIIGMYSGSPASFSSLSNVPGDGWTSGDTIELEAEGSTIRVFRNGVFLRSVVDTTIPGASTDRAGVVLSNSVAPSHLDSWEGGTLGGGGTLLADTVGVVVNVTDATLTSSGASTYTLSVEALSVLASVAPSLSDYSLSSAALGVDVSVSQTALLRGYSLLASGLNVAVTVAPVGLFVGNFTLSAAVAQVFANIQDVQLVRGYRMGVDGFSILATLTTANLDSSVRPSVSIQLVSTAIDITPRAGLTGLKWAWWDTVSMTDIGAQPPVDWGTDGFTDGDGMFRVELFNSTLQPGETGTLLITDSDGTTTQTPPNKAYFGPVQVT